MRIFITIKRVAAVAVLTALPFFTFPTDVRAAVTDEISSKQQQIEELRRQIDELEGQIDQNQSKAATLDGEIKKLNALISKIAYEIRSLDISVDKTALEIGDTETKIASASEQINKHKGALAQYMRFAYEIDRHTLTEILLNHDTLSDFFNELNSVQNTQDSLRITIESIKGLKEDLGVQKEDLEEKKADFERLKGLQEMEKRNLGLNKSEKNKLLKETKGEESKFQDLLKKKQQDLNAIQAQIYYLQQNGVSVQDAVKYAQLAAIRAGIRPAFLLGLLEVESGLGKNVGKGNWKDDMYLCYLRLSKIAKTDARKQHYVKRAENEKSAFFAIIGKLGLNADTVKVSREPSYGCGGALGPAQFIPTTWLSYENEVSQLTGHTPANPWNIEDAFTASAVKLARAGATAKTKTAETGAAKAYLSGRSTCSSAICNSYARSVLDKAAKIEPNL
ncbi:MAG: lytic murein transglycosylase [Acidobacteria bacterium]|nr:lytic murein transglycosylase [Acidobacteriota bacterium]